MSGVYIHVLTIYTHVLTTVRTHLTGSSGVSAAEPALSSGLYASYTAWWASVSTSIPGGGGGINIVVIHVLVHSPSTLCEDRDLCKTGWGTPTSWSVFSLLLTACCLSLTLLLEKPSQHKTFSTWRALWDAAVTVSAYSYYSRGSVLSPDLSLLVQYLSVSGDIIMVIMFISLIKYLIHFSPSSVDLQHLSILIISDGSIVRDLIGWFFLIWGHIRATLITLFPYLV